MFACAAVAQLDRVLGYEPRGRGFNSCQPHQNIGGQIVKSDPLFRFRTDLRQVVGAAPVLQAKRARRDMFGGTELAVEMCEVAVARLLRDDGDGQIAFD